MISPDDLSPDRRLRYYWIAKWGLLLAVVIHLSYFAFSLHLGANTLAFFKLFCIVLDLLAFWFARQGMFKVTILIIWIHLILQEPIATAAFGWHSGFALYLILLPQILFLHQGISHLTRITALAGLIPLIAWRAVTSLATEPLVNLDGDGVRLLFALNLSITLLAVSCLSILFYVGIVRMQQELSTLATTDVLTGLRNRRTFAGAIEDLVRQSLRHNIGFSVGVIDIDHFKRINDTYGHAIGDETLTHCAGLMRTYLKAGDLAFRWGGEEFVVIFKDSTLAEARLAADRLRKLLAGSRDQGARLPPFTVTIGLAEWQRGEDADTLFRRADRALFAGKRSGRNCTMTSLDCIAPPSTLANEAAGGRLQATS